MKHERLALMEAASARDSALVLSGYPSVLYDGALAGWRRIEMETMADGAKPRLEVLWINPRAAAALDHEHGGGGTPLFDHGGVRCAV